MARSSDRGLVSRPKTVLTFLQKPGVSLSGEWIQKGSPAAQVPQGLQVGGVMSRGIKPRESRFAAYVETEA